MSAPTFKIVGGWLHVDGYRIKLETVTKYWLFLPTTVSIYQGAAVTVLSDIKIVDALDEWFEDEGEVKQIIGFNVRIDNAGKDGFVVDDKGNEHYYTYTSKGLAT